MKAANSLMNNYNCFTLHPINPKNIPLPLYSKSKPVVSLKYSNYNLIKLNNDKDKLLFSSKRS